MKRITAQWQFKELYEAIPRGYVFEEKDGIGLYRLPALQQERGVEHGFTARTGGVSKEPYASLNLSFTNDSRSDVLENYRRFARAAGFPADSMVMDTYEHGVKVFIVDQEDRGKGYTLPSLPSCDGLVTKEKGLTLITGHADCMAFYFYDRAKGIVGLCHAGWRGALNRIGLEVLSHMHALGSDSRDILAGVGPSICPSCFEVGADVAKLFADSFPVCPLIGRNERGTLRWICGKRRCASLWRGACCRSTSLLWACVPKKRTTFIPIGGRDAPEAWLPIFGWFEKSRIET